MTAIPLTVASVSPARQAKLIFYVRAVVAVAMIGAWAVAAASGLLLWLAVDGRGAGRLPWLFGATKHTCGAGSWPTLVSSSPGNETPSRARLGDQGSSSTFAPSSW